MRHKMKLKPAPFRAVASGEKVYELRLLDEKRQKVKVGDEILFAHTEQAGVTLLCRVLKVLPYPDFATLYASLPLTACGYTEEEAKTASPDDMTLYYPKEMQAKYGVVAFHISLVAINGYQK